MAVLYTVKLSAVKYCNPMQATVIYCHKKRCNSYSSLLSGFHAYFTVKFFTFQHKVVIANILAGSFLFPENNSHNILWMSVSDHMTNHVILALF